MAWAEHFKVSFILHCFYDWVVRGMVNSGCVFDKFNFFTSFLFNLFGYDMIYLWNNMNFLMKHMRNLWNKYLMEFNLYIQVNFVKELETSFWYFVHKLFEEIIIRNLYHRTDVYSHFH